MKIFLCSGILFLAISLSSQWTTLQGPYNGRIWDYSNEGPSTYVLGDCGLFRSDNNGKNWIPLSENIPPFIEALAFCVDGDEVFFHYKDFISREYKLAYSNDKGADWKDLPLPDPDWSTVYNLTYRNGILITIHNDGLIESLDKGNTWISSNLNRKISRPQYVRSNHNYFYCAQHADTIFRRAINDTSWQLISTAPGYFSSLHVSDSLLILFKDDNKSLRSVNNGDTWQAFRFSNNSAMNFIAEFGDTLYYAEYEYIYKSTNRGSSWKTIKQQNPGRKFRDLLRVGNSLLASDFYDGLILSTDEFQTYTSASVGMYGGNSNRLLRTDSFLYVLGYSNLGAFDLINQKWSDHIYLFDDAVENISYHEGKLYVSSAYTNNFYISSDRGKSFKKNEIDVWFPGFRPESRILVKDDKMVMNGLNGLIVSLDEGETWDYFEIRDWITNKLLNCYDIVMLDQFVVCIARENNGYKLYKSNDLLVWEEWPVNFPQEFQDAGFWKLMCSSNHLFFGMFQQNGEDVLYQLDNSTLNVGKCSGIRNIYPPGLDQFNRILEKGNKLILNAYDGYYYSQDEGKNWSKVIDKLNLSGHNVLSDMVLIDDRIYASSYYFGVLTMNFDSIASEAVSGLLYYDENQNGSYDAGDKPLPDAFVQILSTGNYIPAGDSGNYHFIYTAAAGDTLLPKLHFKHGFFQPAQLAFQPGDRDLNFGYVIPSQVQDLSLDVIDIGAARPGFNYSLDLRYKNQGAGNCNAKLILQLFAGLGYQSASIPPDQINANSLVWNISGLEPFESNKIRLQFRISDTLQLNSIHEIKAELNDLSCMDIDLTDNTDQVSIRIVGSYDPNEIRVDKNEINRKELENKIPLTYTVHFQNTGNYPAEFVRVVNHLGNFDLNSFKILDASHKYSYTINDVKQLEVIFDMIHLPDSVSDESNSHGYFKYSISALPDQVYNNIISNRASIYFDYNVAVNTNQVITKVIEVTSGTDLEFRNRTLLIAIPNPAHSECRLYSPLLEILKDEWLRIYDMNGNCVFKEKMKVFDGMKINLSGLHPGIYHLQIGNQKRLTCKIVINPR